jgi:predicted  nucleic acid-binding Zn-ribbon protein
MIEAVETPAYVERLVVEEGFLDGLDLSFSPGLNVVIGPRGVGKTSLIQLLRYCFGTPALSARFEETANHHVRSILGPDGRVSATLRVSGETFAFSRRSKDELPEGEIGAVPLPTVLAQLEVEELGTDPLGRLRLIDGFRKDAPRKSDRERALLSEIESLTVALSDLRTEIEDRTSQLSSLTSAQGELAAAEAKAREMRLDVSEVSTDAEELDALGRRVADLQVRAGSLERSISASRSWLEEIAAVRRSGPTIEGRSTPERADPLEGLRRAVLAVEGNLSDALDALEQENRFVENALDEDRNTITELEDRARELRRKVDAVTAGAGAATREVAALRERIAQREALSELSEKHQKAFEDLASLRDQALDLLDQQRETRHAERVRVAKKLNGALNPQVEISVKSSGLWEEYADAITESLRGSGLHYSDLSGPLADGLSPRQLALAVEANDASSITDCAGIPPDRARRVIDRLAEAGLGPILTANVDDLVEISLLTGGDYRPSEDLSTGQRCTAMLPVLLRHSDRPVVLDQPEDHLDGAFIVDTLVKGIRQRDSGSQLIIATHNANIPVLGDASQVTILGSDGRRGYELHTGTLDDSIIVEAITSILEGGREAFARRAAFYGAQ